MTSYFPEMPLAVRCPVHPAICEYFNPLMVSLLRFFPNIIKTWTLSSFYIELGIYNQTQKTLVRFILCLAALRNKMISQILNNINLVNFRIFLKWWYCENIGYYWDYWPKIMSILLWSLWLVLNNKLINN